MRRLFLLPASIAFIMTACKQHRYYDLTAGEYIKIEKDARTGQVVNSKTHRPVYMYVDSKTSDTIYGKTGEVINGHVMHSADGKYQYDNDEDYAIKKGDYKEKVDANEVKIKTDDRKIKIEDGKRKTKND